MKVSIIQMYEEFVKKKKKFLNFDNHDSFKITTFVAETYSRVWTTRSLSSRPKN